MAFAYFYGLAHNDTLNDRTRTVRSESGLALSIGDVWRHLDGVSSFFKSSGQALCWWFYRGPSTVRRLLVCLSRPLEAVEGFRP